MQRFLFYLYLISILGAAKSTFYICVPYLCQIFSDIIGNSVHTEYIGIVVLARMSGFGDQYIAHHLPLNAKIHKCPKEIPVVQIV